MREDVMVVMPHRGKAKYTERALKSLEGQVPRGMILDMDNLNDPEFKDLNLHEMWNYGLRRAYEEGWPYVLISNNDVVYQENAIQELVALLEDDPTIGVACVNSSGQPPKPRSYNVESIGAVAGQFSGWGFMMRASMNILFPSWLCWWAGDNWLLGTVPQLGWRVVHASRAIAEHQTSTTVNETMQEDPRFKATLHRDVALMQSWYSMPVETNKAPRPGRYGDG